MCVCVDLGVVHGKAGPLFLFRVEKYIFCDLEARFFLVGANTIRVDESWGIIFVATADQKYCCETSPAEPEAIVLLP